ncbi:MAG: hypothetical protein CMJ31_05355 [Phycisphaerae bacterium]|nr:hypothetical protein [Phycisphaerae bacterium]
MPDTTPPKRKRHPVRNTFLVLLGLVVVAGLAVAIKLTAVLNRQPTIEIDYLTQINEPAALAADDDRAWPIYERAIEVIGEPEQSLREIMGQNDDDPAPSAEDIERLHALAPTLDLVEQAAAKPAMGWTATGGGHLYVSLSEQQRVVLHGARNIARALADDASLAATEGDLDRATGRLIALLGLAEHAAQPPTLIAELVRIAVLWLAIEGTLELINEHPDTLSEAQLASIAAELAEAHRNGPAIGYDIERMLLDDFMQRSFTNDGSGSGKLAPSGVAGMAGSGTMTSVPVNGGIVTAAAALFASSREEVKAASDAAFDRAAELAQTPFSAWVDPDREIDAIDDAARVFPPDITMMMLGVMLPAVNRSAVVSQTTTQAIEAAQVAVALARHRAATGAWPATLDEIDDRFLPEVPIDRFDAQPLRYRLTEDGPLLYSIGMDGDDDGGRPARRASNWQKSARRDSLLKLEPEDHDGDWVFLPPADD